MGLMIRLAKVPNRHQFNFYQKVYGNRWMFNSSLNDHVFAQLSSELHCAISTTYIIRSKVRWHFDNS